VFACQNIDSDVVITTDTITSTSTSELPPEPRTYSAKFFPLADYFFVSTLVGAHNNLVYILHQDDSINADYGRGGFPLWQPNRLVSITDGNAVTELWTALRYVAQEDGWHYFKYDEVYDTTLMPNGDIALLIRTTARWIYRPHEHECGLYPTPIPEPQLPRPTTRTEYQQYTLLFLAPCGTITNEIDFDALIVGFSQGNWIILALSDGRLLVWNNWLNAYFFFFDPMNDTQLHPVATWYRNENWINDILVTPNDELLLLIGSWSPYPTPSGMSHWEIQNLCLDTGEISTISYGYGFRVAEIQNGITNDIYLLFYPNPGSGMDNRLAGIIGIDITSGEQAVLFTWNEFDVRTNFQQFIICTSDNLYILSNIYIPQLSVALVRLTWD